MSTLRIVPYSNNTIFLVTVIDLSSKFESAPDFFKHYRTFWVGNAPLCADIPEQEIRRRRAMVMKYLHLAEERLKNIGLSTNKISAILFVGTGGANGHAFFDGKHYVAWFDLASFASELAAKVFVTHELIHALHYSMSEGFYFRTVEEKNSCWRQFITEGIATFITQQLWSLSDEESLWGDFLPPEQLTAWMDKCKSQENELRAYLKKNFESNDSSITIFEARNPGDIYAYRAGYFIGLNAISEIVTQKSFSIGTLLTMDSTAARSLVLDILS